MVRDATIAPPSRYKRLLAIFERLVHRISLSLSDLGGSSSVLLELEDLKLRLSDASLAAVAKMRAGTTILLSGEGMSERCFVKLSAELHSIAYARQGHHEPALIGLEQITDVGVMANTGEFRSWRAVDPNVAAGPDSFAAMRKLIEAATFEMATAAPEPARPSTRPGLKRGLTRSLTRKLTTSLSPEPGTDRKRSLSPVGRRISTMTARGGAGTARPTRRSSGGGGLGVLGGGRGRTEAGGGLTLAAACGDARATGQCGVPRGASAGRSRRRPAASTEPTVHPINESPTPAADINTPRRHLLHCLSESLRSAWRGS